MPHQPLEGNHVKTPGFALFILLVRICRAISKFLSGLMRAEGKTELLCLEVEKVLLQPLGYSLVERSSASWLCRFSDIAFFHKRFVSYLM